MTAAATKSTTIDSIKGTIGRASIRVFASKSGDRYQVDYKLNGEPAKAKRFDTLEEAQMFGIEMVKPTVSQMAELMGDTPAAEPVVETSTTPNSEPVADVPAVDANSTPSEPAADEAKGKPGRRSGEEKLYAVQVRQADKTVGTVEIAATSARKARRLARAKGYKVVRG